MFEYLGKKVKDGKDTALSQGVRMAINTQIKEYGKMLKLNLDSTNKSIELEVMLEGEKESLTVKVRKYEIIEEGGGHRLRIEGIETSRAWIDTVAASYLEGKNFEIPEAYAKLLKAVV